MKPFLPSKNLGLNTNKQMIRIETVQPDGVVCDGKITYVGENKVEVIMSPSNTYQQVSKSVVSSGNDNTHKEIKVVGVLDPLKNGSEGWIAILSSKELLPGVESLVKVQLYELPTSRLKTHRINVLFPSRAYLYIGEYSICDGRGVPIEISTNPLNILKVKVECSSAIDPSEFTKRINRASIKTVGARNGNVILASPRFRKVTSNPTAHSKTGFEHLRTLGHCINSLQTHLLQGAQGWLAKTFLSSSFPMPSLASPYRMLANDTTKHNQSFKWISLKENKKYKKHDSRSVHRQKEQVGFFPDGKIRIEIKTLENKGGSHLVQFGELDVIIIKVVMFSLEENSFQLEVDLVQTFLCKSATDRFRRRITKVLKRSVTTELIWEKGITAGGNYFYVYWHHFQIPEIDNSFDTEWEKFKITNFEHELRIRFFRDNDYSQTIASGCSFPFKIAPVTEYTTTGENVSTNTQFRQNINPDAQ